MLRVVKSKKPVEEVKVVHKVNPKEVRKAYLDKIEDELEEQGVVIFDESNLNINKDYLILPIEITEIASRDLGEHLNAITQQKIYLRTLLGRISLVMEDKRRHYIESSKGLYEEHSKSKLSETAKDRIINSDNKVKDLYYDYVDMKKKYDMIDISILNMEDAFTLVSREITRRTGDFNNETITHNVNNRR